MVKASSYDAGPGIATCCRWFERKLAGNMPEGEVSAVRRYYSKYGILPNGVMTFFSRVYSWGFSWVSYPFKNPCRSFCLLYPFYFKNFCRKTNIFHLASSLEICIQFQETWKDHRRQIFKKKYECQKNGFLSHLFLMVLDRDFFYYYYCLFYILITN